MQHGDVVFRFLVPADQDSPEAVEGKKHFPVEGSVYKAKGRKDDRTRAA